MTDICAIFKWIGLGLIVLASLIDWKASFDAREEGQVERCLDLQLRAIYWMIAAIVIALLILIAS